MTCLRRLLKAYRTGLAPNVRQSLTDLSIASKLFVLLTVAVAAQCHVFPGATPFLPAQAPVSNPNSVTGDTLISESGPLLLTGPKPWLSLVHARFFVVQSILV